MGCFQTCRVGRVGMILRVCCTSCGENSRSLACTCRRIDCQESASPEPFCRPSTNQEALTGSSFWAARLLRRRRRPLLMTSRRCIRRRRWLLTSPLRSPSCRACNCVASRSNIDSQMRRESVLTDATGLRGWADGLAESLSRTHLVVYSVSTCYCFSHNNRQKSIDEWRAEFAFYLSATQPWYVFVLNDRAWKRRRRTEHYVIWNYKTFNLWWHCFMLMLIRLCCLCWHAISVIIPLTKVKHWDLTMTQVDVKFLIRSAYFGSSWLFTVYFGCCGALFIL